MPTEARPTGLRHELRRTVDALSRPEVFSPGVYWTALVSAVITIFVIDVVNSDQKVAVLGVGLATLAPGAAVILAGRALRQRLTSRSAAIVVASLTYVLAVDLKFGLAAAWNAGLGHPTRPTLEAFTGQGTPVLIAIVIVIRIAVHRADHLVVAAELEAERQRLLAVSTEFEERVAQAQQSLTDQVAAELAPTIDEIRVKLQHLAIADERRASEAIDTLTRAVSDVVRPMSHSLLIAETTAGLDRQASTRPQPRLDLFSAKIDLTRILNLPFLIALELVEATIWGPLFGVVSSSVLGDVINSISTGLGAGLIVALWPQRWRQMSLLRAGANILAIYLTMAVAPRVALHFLAPEVFYNPFLLAHLLDRGGLILLFIVGGALAQVDAQTRRELRRVNDELEVLIARLRRELGAHRKRLSWLLHGPIQSALVSAAIGLSRGDRIDVSAFNARIDDAVAQIHSGYQRQRDLDQAIAQITGVWSEAMEIRVSISEGVRALLDSEPSLSEATAEVLTEATSNAFRHGAASEVDIELDRNPRGQLLVRVVNNGKALDPNHSPGLGTRLLDELCLHWSLRPEGDRTVLSAVVV